MRHTFILKYLIIIISFFMIGNLKAQTSLATNRRQGICTSLRSGHSQALQGRNCLLFRNRNYQRVQGFAKRSIGTSAGNFSASTCQ